MNRDDILEAAAQVISKKGFHAASMQDIAEAVHLQKGSLYYHISSKQEILADLLDRGLDLLIERISGVLDQPVSPEDKLRQAMRVYLESMAEYSDLASVLLLEHRSLEPEFQGRHIPRRDRFEGMWRDLIIEGEQAGVFACFSPSLAARALLGVMNWTITWYRPDGPLSASQIAEEFAELFLEGLVVRPSTNGARMTERIT
ncbi:MAG TPA: TetR/AcrR family transcriptional regulator [Anaerolineales bacterium]|nr:TetR/AcrR family transcriptional regulator [Anaerolineales bacterium]